MFVGWLTFPNKKTFIQVTLKNKFKTLSITESCKPNGETACVSIPTYHYPSCNLLMLKCFPMKYNPLCPLSDPSGIVTTWGIETRQLRKRYTRLLSYKMQYVVCD